MEVRAVESPSVFSDLPVPGRSPQNVVLQFLQRRQQSRGLHIKNAVKLRPALCHNQSQCTWSRLETMSFGEPRRTLVLVLITVAPT